MVDKYNYRSIAEYRPVRPDPKRPHSEQQLIAKTNKKRKDKDEESILGTIGIFALVFGFGYMLLVLAAAM